MSVSQFTVYKSSDTSAPSLTGSSGGLISVLDGCLVTGYGSKVAAGWTHPVATASNIASYLKGGGISMGLVVNDASPNATSLGKEAWAIGWESVAGVGSPVGSGTGQFPIPAQLLTTGHTVIRKSATNDGTVRNWVMFADNRTFYLFAATGDTAGQYFCFGFGSIYGLGGSDSWRVLIMGRNTENSTTAAAVEGFDLLSVANTAVVGNYMARTYAGTGASIAVGKHGDATKGSASTYLGSIQYPNGTDTELYLSPIWVCETTPMVRGLLRGLYQPLHAIANFSDGQTFSGTGAYAGKTFYVVKQTPNAGAVFVETSNTVLTN